LTNKKSFPGLVNSRRSVAFIIQCIMYEQQKRFFSEQSQALYLYSSKLYKGKKKSV